MGLESSDVVRFGLGPLLQGQTSIAKLKSVEDGKPATYLPTERQ